MFDQKQKNNENDLEAILRKNRTAEKTPMSDAEWRENPWNMKRDQDESDRDDTFQNFANDGEHNEKMIQTIDDAVATVLWYAVNSEKPTEIPEEDVLDAQNYGDEAMERFAEIAEKIAKESAGQTEKNELLAAVKFLRETGAKIDQNGRFRREKKDEKKLKNEDENDSEADSAENILLSRSEYNERIQNLKTLLGDLNPDFDKIGSVDMEDYDDQIHEAGRFADEMNIFDEAESFLKAGADRFMVMKFIEEKMKIIRENKNDADLNRINRNYAYMKKEGEI